MIKIPTLFKKNPQNLALVINEVNPGCEWVFNGEGIATRKYDGTAAAIINGELYKRYDVKKGRAVPEGAIPCQEPDAITGHWPHWVKVDFDNKEDKYFKEAWGNLLNVAIVSDENFNTNYYDGTYELCGPKVQGNPEKFDKHVLVKHGSENLFMALSLRKRMSNELVYNFEYFKQVLSEEDIEGIVFHHKTDGRMCKIIKSDFGIKRIKEVKNALSIS